MAVLEEKSNLFLKGLSFFRDLPEKDVEGLLHSAEIRTYHKNSPLILHGDKADRLFVILNGWVKLYRETNEGEEAIIALFTRGDVFGEAAIFEGAVYPFFADVVEETRLVEIPARTLREYAKHNPDIASRIMESMSREIHKLQIENEHLAIMTAPQRVGCLLLQLSSDMVGKGGAFTFPFDKSLAAARLGMKPETFSRSLAQLKPLGVTVAGSEIRIDSFDCLIGYVCGHCSSMPGECKGQRQAECCDPACRQHIEPARTRES